MAAVTTMSELAAAAKGQRRSELYGPDRCLARDAAKQKLVEDHVKQNFQKGAEIVHSSHTFQTTTSGHFGVHKGDFIFFIDSIFLMCSSPRIIKTIIELNLKLSRVFISVLISNLLILPQNLTTQGCLHQRY